MQKAIGIVILLFLYVTNSLAQEEVEKVFSIECNPCADTIESRTRWGVINSKTKKIILPALYDRVELMGSSFYWVTMHKRYALFKKDKAITSFKYQNNYCPRIDGGVIAVKIDQVWGSMDTTGKQVLPMKYDWVKESDKGVRPVKLDNKWGMVENRGTEILPPIYDELIDLQLYILKKDQKYFVFNPATRKLSPFSFDEVAAGRCDRWRVRLNGHCGYLNNQGDIIINPSYSEAFAFEEQCAAVSLDGKWGFINMKGESIVPLIYEKVQSFSSELAPVKLNGKWGFVNKSGKVIFVPQFDEIQSKFYDGISDAIVLNRKKENPSLFTAYLLDKTGKILSNGYDEIGVPADGIIRVKLNGKYGFINTTGRLVVPCIYQDVEYFNNGKAKVTKDGASYYVDKNGKRL